MGQHYKPSVGVWGGGGCGGRGRLRNKNLAGGGVVEKMTGLPKICPAPPPEQIMTGPLPNSELAKRLYKDVRVGYDKKGPRCCCIIQCMCSNNNRKKMYLPSDEYMLHSLIHVSP